VRPGCVQGHYSVADRAISNAGPDFAHGPGAEIADHMWHRGKLPDSPSEQVTPLDTDGLGIDDHETVRAFGLGHVFVAKHPGPSVLIDHGSFHEVILLVLDTRSSGRGSAP
jgi:hypothetical protein